MNVFILFVLCLVKAVYTVKSCTTPNGEQAKCIPIKECQVFLDVLKVGVHPPPSVADFMRNSSCGFDDGPMVCCGSFNHSRELTPANSDPRKHKNFHLLPRNCGLQEVDERVPSADSETQLDEFPWMGLMEYDSGSFSFLCGATLISNQYAVTAAYCATASELERTFSVRFGDHDLKTKLDCRKEFDGIQSHALCVEDYQDIGIDRIITHPANNPNNYINDIALIRLAKPVKITTNVRPVCLPLDHEKYPPGKRMFVAGWGVADISAELNIISTSTVKRKASVPILPNEKCKEIYANTSAHIGDHQICAGGEEAVDTCAGDGGNALVNVNKGSGFSQWYIQGIVSFGATCGATEVPGVYTRVSSYVNWILDLME